MHKEEQVKSDWTCLISLRFSLCIGSIDLGYNLRLDHFQTDGKHSSIVRLYFPFSIGLCNFIPHFFIAKKHDLWILGSGGTKKEIKFPFLSSHSAIWGRLAQKAQTITNRIWWVLRCKRPLWGLGRGGQSLNQHLFGTRATNEAFSIKGIVCLQLHFFSIFFSASIVFT